MKLQNIFDIKLLKFIIVGIINTVTGAIIMFLLYNAANMSYWFSSACNYIFVSILSFFLNKYFTFNVRKWSLFMIITFILNIIICYIIAYGLAKPLVNYFLKNSSQVLRENIALLCGMCIFTGLNYFGQRFIVFKKY